MYVILCYDVGEDRVGKVCKFMRRYLPRVQNSVFEGELTDSKLAAVRSGVLKIIEPDVDSILIWVFRDQNWVDRQVVGREKLPVSNFL